VNEFIKFRNRKIRIALYCNNPRCSVVGWFLYLKKILIHNRSFIIYFVKSKHQNLDIEQNKPKSAASGKTKLVAFFRMQCS